MRHRYGSVDAAQYRTEHALCLEEFLMLYDPNAVYIPENGKLNSVLSLQF